MANFEITDLGKFLEEQSEEIKVVEETTEEEKEETMEDEHGEVDEEDVLVPPEDSEEDAPYDGDMPEHCENFCLQSMRMYVNVHLWHFQTDSYAEHEALEDYYEDLFELTDTFVEATIANQGSLSCDHSYNLEILPYSEMLDEIESYKELVEQHKEGIEDDGMINTLDDILTITDEVLYKLKNLKWGIKHVGEN